MVNDGDEANTHLCSKMHSDMPSANQPFTGH